MVRSKIFFLLSLTTMPCSLGASGQKLQDPVKQFCEKYLQGSIREFSFSALVTPDWKKGIKIPEAGFLPFSVFADIASAVKASCSTLGVAFIAGGLLHHFLGTELKGKAVSHYSIIEQAALTPDQLKSALENEEVLKRSRLETIHSLVLGALCITTGYALNSTVTLGTGGDQLILPYPKGFELVRFSIKNPN